MLCAVYKYYYVWRKYYTFKVEKKLFAALAAAAPEGAEVLHPAL